MSLRGKIDITEITDTGRVRDHNEDAIGSDPEIGLMVLAYFGLAAPWGVESVANSDPRMDFAPLVYVVGVMLALGSALVYTMLPDRTDDD